MDSLIATAGLIAVGAVTPGPNTLIVLHESAQGGWPRALPAATGILAGGLALLLAVSLGANELIGAHAALAAAASGGAALMLAASGLATVVRTFGSRAPVADTRTRTALTGFRGLFVLQFLNPKAWLLVTAAVASMGTSPNPGVAIAQLAALFVVIPGLSLALWCFAGTVSRGRHDGPPMRLWLDRGTGVLLTGFALLLLFEACKRLTG